ncbi:MAG: NAD-dependent epimerase [Bacteroidetes bacterium]|nr:NAD-dependent epimerase [Bacteroidota bacterium]
MNILVTGTAGFIGYHVVQRLLSEGHQVTGIDSINDYYDVSLKMQRLERSGIAHPQQATFQNILKSDDGKYIFYRSLIEDKKRMEEIFQSNKYDRVIHLAAQAGVRYSLENPQAYITSNIDGFAVLLECCRHAKIEHLVYASSSSVYGMNDQNPFSVNQNVDHPVSLYAATKKSNELMAHAYSHLFQLPTTGLRFFTAYGPWGRPDMALFIFTRSILEGKPIQVFNEGNMLRDFTFIDDIVDGVVRVMNHIPKGDPGWINSQSDISSSKAPYKIYNIGNHAPVRLLDFISAIEKELGKEAIKEYLPMQPGDVPETFADIHSIVEDTGYQPSTSIAVGIKKFIDWYKMHYKI